MMTKTIANSGNLYVVATPIGNLDDISGRARSVLAEVDFIYAEDTRVGRKLLGSLGIAGRLMSLHEHNETQRVVEIIDALTAGSGVALISDAGTPLINDPGYRVVSAALGGGIRVVPVPGPCALIAALSVSGQPVERFVFEGFPPRRGAARRRYFESLADESRTLVFYESTHRIAASVADMSAAFGAGRAATVLRELTKRYESVMRAPLGRHAERLADAGESSRGEFVVVVAGNADATASRAGAEFTAKSHPVSIDGVLAPLLETLALSQAVAVAATILGQSKNVIYERALAIKNQS